MAAVLSPLNLVNKRNPIIQQNQVGVIFISGQSNCGRCTTTEFTGSAITTYSGSAGIPGFQIYNQIWDANSMGQMSTGVNTMLNNFNNTNEFGMETSLARQMAGVGVKEMYICKIGVGNTSLATYFSDLFPGDFLIKSNLEKTFQLILAAGKIPVLQYFIWMQGENDAAVLTEANNYGTALTTFFSSFSIWMGNMCVEYSLPQSNMNYVKVIGQINGASDPTETFYLTVRAAQAAYCSTGSNNAKMIVTTSYPLESDLVHYTAAGQIQFGNDIWTAISGSYQIL